MTIKPAGDQAVTVEFADTIDEAVNARVIALAFSLKARPVAGIVETVPAYRSLLVCYDPAVIRGAQLVPLLYERLEHTGEGGEAVARHFRVPVCYQGDDALDLADLADMKGISPEEVIALHTAASYRVYMIGFAPGFTYLGGLPEALHTPRLAVPRQKVAAGAVGIGGAQAAINSVSGPSGWRYIGRTPLRLFDPERAEPSFFRAGDLIRFFEIGADEMAALERRAAAGETIVEAA
ncbi:5-oxoprolinase subunit PxpB [Martelella soudanensis]|uniref:5-oxoprolinase subunit PxpB n=1 Tax=unclassified Martelella TaxID=2629616 RepID=UPI001FEE4573|nr:MULTISPECIES: 5-oxoprolinase subunit PxpB [unclassified Martelella]